jgi:ABC-type branched-subunit amino acid transport system permease subunit
MGSTTGAQFLLGNDGIFSLCHHIHTGSGAYPAAYPMDTVGKEDRPWAMKLTTHLHLVPRLRMHGAIPLPPIHPHGVVLNEARDSLHGVVLSYA